MAIFRLPRFFAVFIAIDLNVGLKIMADYGNNISLTISLSRETESQYT